MKGRHETARRAPGRAAGRRRGPCPRTGAAPLVAQSGGPPVCEVPGSLSVLAHHGHGCSARRSSLCHLDRPRRPNYRAKRGLRPIGGPGGSVVPPSAWSRPPPKLSARPRLPPGNHRGPLPGGRGPRRSSLARHRQIAAPGEGGLLSLPDERPRGTPWRTPATVGLNTCCRGAGPGRVQRHQTVTHATHSRGCTRPWTGLMGSRRMTGRGDGAIRQAGGGRGLVRGGRDGCAGVRRGRAIWNG